MMIATPKNMRAGYIHDGAAFRLTPKYKNNPPTKMMWNKCTMTIRFKVKFILSICTDQYELCIHINFTRGSATVATRFMSAFLVSAFLISAFLIAALATTSSILHQMPIRVFYSLFIIHGF